MTALAGKTPVQNPSKGATPEHDFVVAGTPSDLLAIGTEARTASGNLEVDNVGAVRLDGARHIEDSQVSFSRTASRK